MADSAGGCATGAALVESSSSSHLPSRPADSRGSAESVDAQRKRETAIPGEEAESAAAQAGGWRGRSFRRNNSPAKAAPVACPAEDLPIHGHRDAILRHINANRITCIQGETGCGKSTQLPKFLLQQDALASETLRALKNREAPPAESLPLPPLENYRPLKCIVTQPRRLACISLAQRVSQELGEPLGRSVGYQISGDCCVSSQTRVVFMTTGCFLQVLVNAQIHIGEESVADTETAAALITERVTPAQRWRRAEAPDGDLLGGGGGGHGALATETDRAAPRRDFLSGVTHVILDEVHERGVDADLVSLVLKLHLRSRRRDLRIVVMSATLQGNLFFEYFSDLRLNQTPETKAKAEKEKEEESLVQKRIFVGAKRFPVQLLYLDDVISKTYLQDEALDATLLDGSDLLMEGRDEEQDLERQNKAKGESRSAEEGQPPASQGPNVVRALLFRKGLTNPIPWTDSVARAAMAFSTGQVTETALNQKSVQNLMKELQRFCVNLVTTLAFGGESILVFLPGLAEITEMFELFAAVQEPTEPKPAKPRLKLFALHSTIGREAQKEVLDAPHETTCHVVLASNIAESSLTLPKCRVVVDFCLRRELRFDVQRHCTQLVKTWTSHASSQQRSGRTGRVFPGVCFRLVSKPFYSTLRVFDVPEMLTVPLDKLYLTVAFLTQRLNAITKEATGEAGKQTEGFSAKDGHSGSTRHAALRRLQKELVQLGALSSYGEMTSLGLLMMQLPVDPRLCKMVATAVWFGCPADGIALASCLASGDLFKFPVLGLLQRHSSQEAADSLGPQLQEQLKSRALFDAGHMSEPLMLRNCLVEFLVVFAQSVSETRLRLARQARQRPMSRRLESTFKLNIKVELRRVSMSMAAKHAVIPRRLVQTVLTFLDLCKRLQKCTSVDSRAYQTLTFFSELLSNEAVFIQRGAGDGPASESSPLDIFKFRFDSAVRYDGSEAAAAVSERFSRDMLLLKTLLVSSFAPPFLFGKPHVCLDGEGVAKYEPFPEKGGDDDDAILAESVPVVTEIHGIGASGIDLSRVLYFQPRFVHSLHPGVVDASDIYTQQLKTFMELLKGILPGVDFVLFARRPEDLRAIFVASSEEAERDEAGRRFRESFFTATLESCLVYFPPTLRNECLNFDFRKGVQAARALEATKSATESSGEKMTRLEDITGQHVEVSCEFSFATLFGSLINQFGGGKWAFNVMAPRRNPPYEISLQRPSSPFGVTWHLLSFSEDAAKVSANAAYRNPSGFLGICPKVEKGGQGVAVYRQPKEVFGTFLSMHKKHETSGTVFVEGLTLLPQRQAVLLLMAFLPPSAVKTFSVSFGLSGKLTITGAVIAGRSSPLQFSPEGSRITLEDLMRANIARHFLSEALSRRDSQPTMRRLPGAPRTPPSALIVESPALAAAVHTLIKRCNESLTKEELETGIRLAGTGSHPALREVFDPSTASLLSHFVHFRPKGTPETRVWEIPAFDEACKAEGAGPLPPFNLNGVAAALEGFIRDASTKTATRLGRKGKNPPQSSKHSGAAVRGNRDTATSLRRAKVAHQIRPAAMPSAGGGALGKLFAAAEQRHHAELQQPHRGAHQHQQQQSRRNRGGRGGRKAGGQEAAAQRAVPSDCLPHSASNFQPLHAHQQLLLPLQQGSFEFPSGATPPPVPTLPSAEGAGGRRFGGYSRGAAPGRSGGRGRGNARNFYAADNAGRAPFAISGGIPPMTGAAPPPYVQPAQHFVPPTHFIPMPPHHPPQQAVFYAPQLAGTPQALSSGAVSFFPRVHTGARSNAPLDNMGQPQGL